MDQQVLDQDHQRSFSGNDNCVHLHLSVTRHFYFTLLLERRSVFQLKGIINLFNFSKPYFIFVQVFYLQVASNRTVHGIVPTVIPYLICDGNPLYLYCVSWEKTQHPANLRLVLFCSGKIKCVTPFICVFNFWYLNYHAIFFSYSDGGINRLPWHGSRFVTLWKSFFKLLSIMRNSFVSCL